jgi:hypothetical protein
MIGNITPLPALPLHSQQSLMSIALYEAGYDASEASSISILQKYCYSNLRNSELLIRQVYIISNIYV